MSKIKNQYKPDYIVTPGEVIGEYLDCFGMTKEELAMRTGLDIKPIEEIIEGKLSITSEISTKLEKALGRPDHFWMNLELQFKRK